MTRTFALLFVSSLALGLASTGCTRHIDDPGSHGDGVDETSTDTTTDDSCGAPPGQVSNAIAISLGALEAAESHGDGTSGGTGSGGGGPSPSTIVIKASNRSTYTCDAPLVSTDCSGPTTWEVSVELAPSLVAPGTFDLSDPTFNSFYSITGSDGGGDCWGGGGSFIHGTLVIDSVDATAIHFHLAGTNGNDPGDGVHSDGMYMATRCN